MKIATLLILGASIVVAIPASADTIYWTNWSNNTDGHITTPQGIISVTYSGELDGLSRKYPSWNPSTSYADGMVVDNAPPPSGNMIKLFGGSDTVNTITFSAPLVNPVVSIWSLGQIGTSATFEFINATPTFVAGGPSAEYDGGPISISGNTVSGSEANGTVTFLGTFSSISWNNPLFEFYYGFTVGVGSASQGCQKKLAMMVNASFAGPEAGLYTIQADGSRLTKLLSVPAESHGGSWPHWSPDGTKILFDADFGGHDEIYVINEDGTNLTQLTFDSAVNRDPDWSPDGAMIVFSSNRGGTNRYDLFVMNADGTNIANLTNSPTSDEYLPAWSPDGAHILFDSYDSGLRSDIWIMNADGSGQTDLTPNTTESQDSQARWYPDGSKVIFASSRMGNGDIFLMNPDGTNVIDLVGKSAYDSSATVWSHQDGVIEIAFTRRLLNGTTGVYTMNGDGANQKAIFLPNTQDNLLLDAQRR